MSLARQIHFTKVMLPYQVCLWTDRSSIPVGRRKSRLIGRSKYSSLSYLTPDNHPLIAHPSSKHTHITTIRRAFLNIHPFSRCMCRAYNTTITLPFSIECGVSSIVWPRNPTEMNGGGWYRTVISSLPARAEATTTQIERRFPRPQSSSFNTAQALFSLFCVARKYQTLVRSLLSSFSIRPNAWPLFFLSFSLASTL